jgi:hypothetical protein
MVVEIEQPDEVTIARVRRDVLQAQVKRLRREGFDEPALERQVVGSQRADVNGCSAGGLPGAFQFLWIAAAGRLRRG